MGTKNWVFKSSGRLNWTNTSNCVCNDYYFPCPYYADRRLTEAYQYVITARLQSYPVERRFSQYRQMSGGRFLNNLREVLNSKRILRCHSLIKENKVTTGYVTKKLIKRSHCESYKMLLKGYWKLEMLTQLMMIIKCFFSWWTIHAIKVTFCLTLLFWISFVGNLCLPLVWTRIWFYKCQLSRLGI